MRMRLRSLASRSVAALLLAGAPVVAAAIDPGTLVTALPGDLPLILTVPHDGIDAIGFMRERTRGATGRDENASRVAEQVASLIEARTGKRPYVVIARFSRKYLDANRTPKEAMESEDAMPVYRAYHDRIAEYVAEVRKRFGGRGLLIDVHGQDGAANTTFRGTRAGLTTRELVRKYGPESIQGPQSLIGLLAAKGYDVHPAIGSASLQEDSRYNGGHTVFIYGSHRPGGIDAIQLELAHNHRNDSRFPAALADAILGFMARYELTPLQ
jgi:N-formylglutamate amidohydrolase